jgi:WD40 repeat protein
MTSQNPLRDALMRMPPLLNSPLGSKNSLDDDVMLPSDSTDTISSMSWSPAASHLAAASWDGRVRVYDIAANGTGTGLCAITVAAPILSCDWGLVSFHLSLLSHVHLPSHTHTREYIKTVLGLTRQ